MGTPRWRLPGKAVLAVSLCALAPAALAAAIERLLEDDPVRQAMSRAARLDAETRFRPEPAVDRIEAIYREVLDRWD